MGYNRNWYCTSTDLATLTVTTGTVTVSTSSTVGCYHSNTVDADSTTVVDASTVTTPTGSAADINTVYASSGISGLGNEALH